MRSDTPIGSVHVENEDGALLVRRQAPPSTTELALDLRWEGPASVTVHRDDGLFTLWTSLPPAPGPLVASIDAPVGDGERALGGDLGYLAIDGNPVAASLIVSGSEVGPVVVRVDGAAQTVLVGAPGERLVIPLRLPGDRPTSIEVQGSITLSARLVPRPVPRTALALSVASFAFPARDDGNPDPARPASKITLPSPFWEGITRALHLGVRPLEKSYPWAQAGVVLRNDGNEAIAALVSLSVRDDAGPGAPFRPQLRDGDPSDSVRALIRVPQHGQATAVLPVFVDAASLPDRSEWTARVEVTPLGAERSIAAFDAPLRVLRGNTATSVGALGFVLAALSGLVLIALRLRDWLAALRTADLAVLAVFSTMTFAVTATSLALGAGLAAVLGPLSIFVVGLVDDVLRYALLATLLTLLPRPGTAALWALLSWLMSGLALGQFGALDGLFVASRVFFLEAGLWLAGITRSAGWVDAPRPRRFLRLFVGLGFAASFGGFSSLVAHMTLYRLFFAKWFVGAVVLGPGLLYVAVALWMAVPFAQSLRKVAP